MLCKTTMRAALAHVLGTIGILAAFGAGATSKYALESLIAPVETTGDLKDYYRISAAKAGLIVMSVQLDTLLPINDQAHYLVLDFGKAKLTRRAEPGDLMFNMQTKGADTVKTDDDEFKPFDKPITMSRAYRGDVTDTTVVYRLAQQSKYAGLPIDTFIELELGYDKDDKNGVLAVPDEAGDYGVGVSVYDDLSSARAAADPDRSAGAANRVFTGSSTLFKVAAKLGDPTVMAALATADVANPLGPFLRFVGTTEAASEIGLLATIQLNEGAKADFLKQDGGPADDVLSGSMYTVTSTVGAFKFGKDAADGVPVAFSIAKTAADCSGGKPLELKTSDKKDIAPTDKTNPTFADQATIGEATVEHTGPEKLYFCVNVKDNKTPIPAVGTAADLKGYSINVKPMVADKAVGAGVTKPAGSIDRNGTTVHISYLSDHPQYNQRLAIVNRGNLPADFWIDVDSFQTEAGTEVLPATDISGTVPAGGRMIVRVQDALHLSGATRAAGTLSLNAPSRTIDVMTLQVHPGTGQIDTTIYQHDEG